MPSRYRSWAVVNQTGLTCVGTPVDVSVPETHPPSSRDESVLVDEAAQNVGSSELFGVDVADRAANHLGIGWWALADRRWSGRSTRKTRRGDSHGVDTPLSRRSAYALRASS